MRRDVFADRFVRVFPFRLVSGPMIRIFDFVAEVQICGATRHTESHDTRDTTGARDAAPRTTPPPRARHGPAGLGSAPTPRLSHPGRPTRELPTSNMPPKPMPPSSGPRHFDTRYAPQTPHVASTISEVHASTVHRTQTRQTCTSNPARHHDTLHSTVAMKLESEYGRELSYVVVP